VTEPDARRWIVDAMNVIGSRPDGWWKDRAAATAALVEKLERWAAAQGANVTVVLERPPRAPIAASVIRIAHAPKPRANSADDEIVRLVHADASPQEVLVVTSDRGLAERVRSLGAGVFPAESFRNMIDPRGGEMHRRRRGDPD
jgi:predicted RNA-binding protein with PIN domain